MTKQFVIFALMHAFSRFLLKILGWTAKNKNTHPLGNCVIIVAPHTSLWDFIFGRITLSALKLRGRFLINEKYFKFPYGYLLKWLGGIPVDTSKGVSAAKYAIEKIKQSDDLCLIITPEGTRSYTTKWKKGFYSISQAADIPIYIGYIDYKEKTCCISDVKIIPSGNYTEDFKIIESFYKGRTAMHPERFNLS